VESQRRIFGIVFGDFLDRFSCGPSLQGASSDARKPQPASKISYLCKGQAIGALDIPMSHDRR
jgi:hypothetical protein